MMEVIADLHIHSRYAMACSSRITLEGLESTALEKGINLISTGDFTHPAWLSEIKKTLEPCGETGLFKIKGSQSKLRFVLGSEVSTIFADKNKISKKIHNCILMPSIESVEALNSELSRFGSLASDGRPALSMSAAELVEKAFNSDRDAFVFPAHAWTPYFGVFGSFSGFDSIKEAYQDQEKRIRALETGLSSDPQMNWRVSSLDKYALISNSDMHSLEKMGREANVLDIKDSEITYGSVIKAITDRDSHSFKQTIEFYPEEGKYHYDGHRQCNFSADPDTNKLTKCPVCGKRLVIGVLHRVNDLADRPVGYRPKGAVPYVHMVPLREVIAYVTKKTAYSPVVTSMYNDLVTNLGSEFSILGSADLDKIRGLSNDTVGDAIQNIREDRIRITPGYDGVFGKLDLIDTVHKPEERKKNQRSISEFK
jgi:uncharacterized protein (TIGR00375 family)